MMEQERQRGAARWIKWHRLMAWRIAQIGIEIDARRPLRVHHIDTSPDDEVGPGALVTVPVRLCDGRAIDTKDLPIEPVIYDIGNFSGAFELDGHGVSPLAEDLFFMPDFTCDCRTGEIAELWCDHKLEIWRRNLEIVTEAGQTRAIHILSVLRSGVGNGEVIWDDSFTDLRSELTRLGSEQKSNKRLGSRYRSNKRF